MEQKDNNKLFGVYEKKSNMPETLIASNLSRRKAERLIFVMAKFEAKRTFSGNVTSNNNSIYITTEKIGKKRLCSVGETIISVGLYTFFLKTIKN